MSDTDGPTREPSKHERKIALFGGTFDPIHDGHVFIASEAHRLCSLDEVIFIPCWQSPHKPGIEAAASHHRLAMARLALEDLPWATVSDFEASRSEPSLSWQTARHFCEILPDAQLHWLLGVDQWRVIERWNRPEILAQLLTFVVFGRDGLRPEPKTGFRQLILPGTCDLSATQIRACLAHGTVPVGLNARVVNYLTQHQLYSFGKD